MDPMDRTPARPVVGDVLEMTGRGWSHDMDSHACIRVVCAAAIVSCGGFGERLTKTDACGIF